MYSLAIYGRRFKVTRDILPTISEWLLVHTFIHSPANLLARSLTHSVTQSVSQSINQWINQAINQATNSMIATPCMTSYYYIHPFNGLSSRITWGWWHHKVKPFSILTKQEIMGSGGISWTTCKSVAPRSSQITMPASHHSVFIGWMPFLLPIQQRQSTDGKLYDILNRQIKVKTLMIVQTLRRNKL